MTNDNLETELRNLKDNHLTDGEKAAYCDNELSPIHHDRINAHMKECFRCKEEVLLLLAESKALNNREIVAEDVVSARELLQRSASKKRSGDSGINQ